jgi:hypothetical protein
VFTSLMLSFSIQIEDVHGPSLRSFCSRCYTFFLGLLLSY